MKHPGNQQFAISNIPNTIRVLKGGNSSKAAEKKDQFEMDQYLAEKDIVFHVPVKVQSIEVVKRGVINNLGIAVVPTYSIGEEPKNGSLIPVKTELDKKRIILFISVIKING